jgi:hypothetical protein
MNKDKNNSKKQLNGKLIKESLMDYNNLAEQLKENVAESVKSLLEEQVRQAYASILNESDDEELEEKEYDVEEVEDTQDDSEEAESGETEAETEEDSVEGEGMEPKGDDSSQDTEEIVSSDGEEVDEPEGDVEGEADEFEKYKVSDNKYDFRNAKDDELVKVYKRLTNDDQVTVVMNDDKVSISDKETGADYIIDMSGNDDTSEITDDNFTDDMNESRIYEIALNEYDSNVGYTDNYQKKDVMTLPSAKTGGKGRDIDAGVPDTNTKPWSNKKDAAPFNDKKGKTVECGDVTTENNAPGMEETVAQKGGTNRMIGAKSHIPDTSCTNNPKKHTASKAGEYMSESIVKKANKIFEENKKLKGQLEKITEMLREAAVTNVNLGGIIKLISENSTTKEEKRNIINRFTNEVHTIEESKSLYKTISDELNKKPQTTTNINEEKQIGTANAEVINESKFYQDESLMNSLGLMHKICK